MTLQPHLGAAGEEDPDYEHVLVANGTGMQLSFLGTSSDNPTTLRSGASMPWQILHPHGSIGIQNVLNPLH